MMLSDVVKVDVKVDVSDVVDIVCVFCMGVFLFWVCDELWVVCVRWVKCDAFDVA